MALFHHMKSKRCNAFLLVLMMTTLLLSPFFSHADEAIPSAGVRDPMVRVWLTRMNLTDRLDLTLISPYLLQNEQGLQMHFPQDSQISFLLRNDAIYLHYMGLVQEVGSAISLQRTAENANSESGFYRTNFPELYLGDLSLSIDNGSLRPVLKIHVEDYLLGVVPYEMSESFPVEALKAQAVAARTYVLRKQNPDRFYDVVDTTNDQVFKGYLPGNVRCEQAIRETRGVCGFYKGALAQCYYSASNGGQMELVESVWETKEDFSYYTFGEDPYDVANPESTVRSFEIPKNGQTDAPYELRQLLAAALRDQLPDISAEHIRLDHVNEVSVADPVHEGSKLVTTLQINADISIREKQAVIRLVDSDVEEVSLFLVDSTPVTATPSAEPTSTPETSYGPYRAWEESVVFRIPVFPDAEYTLGMDISGNFDNEIWSVIEKSDRFIIEARRYGHGVGMSQRGAQQMALQHNRTYQEILGFYYPGLKLMQYDDIPVNFAETEEALVEDAGPAASPTPRPTLMPLTLEKADGQWFASVTEITEDSSLNLRAEPNLSSEIKMRLYKNQRLLVLERCLQEGWVKVQTDSVEGYVMEKYLTREE